MFARPLHPVIDQIAGGLFAIELEMGAGHFFDANQHFFLEASQGILFKRIDLLFGDSQHVSLSFAF